LNCEGRLLIEIRWHGRGGQGVVTVSDILARSVIYEGKYAQHFPEFGPERSGAPVKAYTRISDEPIEIHSGIYEPDIIIIIDRNMSKDFYSYLDGLKNDGLLFLNLSKEILNSIGRGRVPIGVKIYVADSKKISLEETGRLIFNIPMLGALARIIRTPKLESIEEILKTRFSDELLEYNIRILKRAYSEVEMFE